MYAFMVTFLSICIVGAAALARQSAGVLDNAGTDKVVAASFNRYANSLRCYGRAYPFANGSAPSIATLKATSYEGAPCLIAAYLPLGIGNGITGPLRPGEFRGWITSTEVFAYTGPKSIKGGVAPIGALYQHPDARSARIGLVGADGVSVIGQRGDVVGALPAGINGAEVGSMVEIFEKQ
jgi:hypothetical protein